MWLHDGDFYEEEREEGKYGGLDETHEEFKGHKWHRPQVRCKINDDGNKHFAGKDVPEKTEGKGNEARELGEKFDDTDDEIYR